MILSLLAYELESSEQIAEGVMNNPQIPTLGSELAPILQLVKVILDFLDQVEIILLLKTQ